MWEALLVLVIAIAVAAAIYYFLKKSSVLIINAIVGLLTLFIINMFDLFGMGSVPINIYTVLVCAFGGLPGAILLILLHFVGIF